MAEQTLDRSRERDGGVGARPAGPTEKTAAPEAAPGANPAHGRAKRARASDDEARSGPKEPAGGGGGDKREAEVIEIDDDEKKKKKTKAPRPWADQLASMLSRGWVCHPAAAAPPVYARPIAAGRTRAQIRARSGRNRLVRGRDYFVGIEEVKRYAREEMGWVEGGRAEPGGGAKPGGTVTAAATATTDKTAAPEAAAGANPARETVPIAATATVMKKTVDQSREPDNGVGARPAGPTERAVSPEPAAVANSAHETVPTAATATVIKKTVGQSSCEPHDGVGARPAGPTEKTVPPKTAAGANSAHETVPTVATATAIKWRRYSVMYTTMSLGLLIGRKSLFVDGIAPGAQNSDRVRVGDFLVAINGQSITDFDQMSLILATSLRPIEVVFRYCVVDVDAGRAPAMDTPREASGGSRA